MKISYRLIAFATVGAIGFFVDTAVLYLLRGALNLYGARAVSFLCAATATWLLNRRFTFRDRSSGHPPAKELLIYIGLMLLGGGFNYATYAWLITTSSLVAAHPIMGVGAGSIAGMFVNLLTSRFALYRKSHARGAPGLTHIEKDDDAH